MTHEEDSSTQHTFLPCIENPECHIMPGEERVSKRSISKREFTSVIVSRTGSTMTVMHCMCGTIQDRSFPVQPIPRPLLPGSLIQREAGGVYFSQKVRNRGPHQ